MFLSLFCICADGKEYKIEDKCLKIRTKNKKVRKDEVNKVCMEKY